MGRAWLLLGADMTQGGLLTLCFARRARRDDDVPFDRVRMSSFFPSCATCNVVTSMYAGPPGNAHGHNATQTLAAWHGWGQVKLLRQGAVSALVKRCHSGGAGRGKSAQAVARSAFFSKLSPSVSMHFQHP